MVFYSNICLILGIRVIIKINHNYFIYMEKLINYFKESKAELTKVTWPTKEQAIQSTILVIMISVGTSVFLGVIDYGLNELLTLVLSR